MVTPMSKRAKGKKTKGYSEREQLWTTNNRRRKRGERRRRECWTQNNTVLQDWRSSLIASDNSACSSLSSLANVFSLYKSVRINHHQCLQYQNKTPISGFRFLFTDTDIPTDTESLTHTYTGRERTTHTERISPPSPPLSFPFNHTHKHILKYRQRYTKIYKERREEREERERRERERLHQRIVQVSERKEWKPRNLYSW